MATETMSSEVTEISTAENVAFVVLAMTTIAVLAICLNQRLRYVRSWKALPFARWLILAIYADSLLFAFLATVFFKGVGIDDKSLHLCNAAALICGDIILQFQLPCLLLFNQSGTILPTNVRRYRVLLLISHFKFIYYFLVEKAYVVRLPMKPRMKDKLYLFNFFGVMVPYVVIICLNFRFRYAYIDSEGQCFLGIKKLALAPFISFEVVINVYLTTLFIVPIRKLYSDRYKINHVLETMALRAFIGSCATLASAVTNLTILMVLDGEKGWICLTCCLADILFTVLVLHWVTSIDQDNYSSSYPSTNPSRNEGQGSGSSALSWADVLVDSSNHPGSWATTDYNDPTPQPTVNTEIVADRKPRGNSIGLETLPGIKIQTEHVREVDVDEGQIRWSQHGRGNSGDPENSTDYIIEPSGTLR